MKETKKNQKEKIKRDTSDQNIQYCVICADRIQFYAVGNCDHNICSLCSLRLRSKENDQQCPICKQNMEYVICYEAKHGIVEFSKFNVWSIDTPTPGFDIDHVTSMLYYNCREHYQYMISLRSISCPAKECGEQFSSTTLLQNHLKDKHDLVMCNLCLKHRPLFISEQTLFKPSQLKKHMTAPPPGYGDKKSDQTGGHPLCKFCNEYFYDTTDLFVHMRDRHTTCPLCLTRHQHRFYRDAVALLNHSRDAHFACALCDDADLLARGTEHAFSSAAGLSQHLRTVHHVSTSGSRVSLALNFKPVRVGEQTAQFLDFDWSSSDPNHDWHELSISPTESPPGDWGDQNEFEYEGEEGKYRGKRRGQSLQIPPNMRIAGRVTGAGQFQYTTEDEKLQAALDETGERSKLRYKQTPVRRDESQFPLLKPAASSGIPVVAGSSSDIITKSKIRGNEKNGLPTVSSSSSLDAIINSVHTTSNLSKSNINNNDNKNSQLNQQLNQNNHIKRQIELAEAFGVKSVSSVASKLMKNTTKSFQNVENFEYYSETLSWIDPVLAEGDWETEKKWDLILRPLFLPGLITFARNSKAELLKIEKKMNDLIHNTTINSVQLKPMPGGLRYIACVLARYYGMNAYEYDYEPKRYVSLVKTSDSRAPPVALSAASSAGRLPGPASSHLPVLCLTIRDNAATFAPLGHSTRGPHSGGSEFTKPMFKVADIMIYVSRAIKADNTKFVEENCRIMDVKCTGPSTVCFVFKDIIAAAYVYHKLESYSVSVNVVTSSWAVAESRSKPLPSSVKLTELFEISTAFDIHSEETNENLNKTLEEYSMKTADEERFKNTHEIKTETQIEDNVSGGSEEDVRKVIEVPSDGLPEAVEYNNLVNETYFKSNEEKDENFKFNDASTVNEEKSFFNFTRVKNSLERYEESLKLGGPGNTGERLDSPPPGFPPPPTMKFVDQRNLLDGREKKIEKKKEKKKGNGDDRLIPLNAFSLLEDAQESDNDDNGDEDSVIDTQRENTSNEAILQYYKWTCKTCTFINEGHRSSDELKFSFYCEMCQSERKDD